MPRNKKQKESARKASNTYRDKLRDAGIPTGTQITHQLAIATVRLLARGHTLTKANIGLVLQEACRQAGWDATDEHLRSVVNRRLNVMRKMPVATDVRPEAESEEVRT